MFSKDLIQKPYKIVLLKNQEVIWATSEFEIFFVEKNKKFWETRLSTYLPLNYFFELLTEPQERIRFCYDDDCVIFKMKKKYFAVNRQIAKTIKIQTSQQ
ncbi:MAG: hypothetical protein NZ522_04495 [Chitinophagales bacterium]|nr:hypothetical protein [Chitinophagales bacterium]